MFKSGFRHPLLPLLILISEKCELASISTMESCTDWLSKSFDQDIRVFTQAAKKEGRHYVADSEVDDLVKKSYIISVILHYLTES